MWADPAAETRPAEPPGFESGVAPSGRSVAHGVDIRPDPIGFGLVEGDHGGGFDSTFQPRAQARKEAAMTDHLTPLARRVLALRERGETTEQIAERLKCSPSHVERIEEWASIPRTGERPRRHPTAFARRIHSLREAGHTHDEIAERFRRSPDFIRRVDGLAHYQIALRLLNK